MPDTLINPDDTIERQNEKLLKIAGALMGRVEQGSDVRGMAYAQFERAVMLEAEVGARTRELEHALNLLNKSNAQLAEANADAEAARANLATAIETVQEGFALFDANEVLVMCNSRFGQHMRDIHHLFKPGLAFHEYVELASQSPFLYLPEGTTPAQWAAMRMTRHKDDHVVFNARMAGSRWLQVSEHRTHDGGTVVLQTDVTDMMLLERQERERLLDDQARLIKATLEHLDQGVCIFDDEARLVGWNRRLSELLSIPTGRFRIGTPFFSIYRQMLRDNTFLDANRANTLVKWSEGKDARAPLSLEMAFGPNRILAVFAQQMPDGGFVISFTDVSAERAAARALSEVNETLERRVMDRTLELEDALAEAERANASKSRFVAAASHDLLQPLSAAKLYLASIDSDLHDPELRQRLGKTESALKSVESILGALLDISRLDSGSASVDLTGIALNRMLGQLRDEMAPQAAEKGLSLSISQKSAWVHSDATYLRRILQNLISNALRYTTHGEVRVDLQQLDDRLSVSISDTGPGIPIDHQDKVFDEFHRVNSDTGPADGLGLGLAIVDRACRLLKHPLRMISKTGQGTTFTIELPLATQFATERPERPNVAENTPLQRIVLLIENDDVMRNALTMTLEGWGADVLPCANGGDALKLLEEIDIAPDIVLADYQLNDGALGTDTIAILQQKFGDITCCVITANRIAPVPEECARLGAMLLYKPINLVKLRAFVEQAATPGSLQQSGDTVPENGTDAIPT
ncbi:PAS-domain containing protein [Shimia abyssi]|uniref:histidine kinase n=1 Tax=Shimia abyssi TaxID=1662395 RepID=A0A2P8FEI5_9RHOB|nr:PAS-domain containing protein [Shimia abyssi]PSL20145.1 hypothetical protein CLV88_104206 [Shimia abyssi]